MGFLDRLVADLVARETGLPVRGLVRRAGVGRLVAAGGLLAAGAAAVDWVQKQQASGSGPGPRAGAGLGSGSFAPPPPPGSSSRATHGPNVATVPLPLPPPAALPPLPDLPLPSFATAPVPTPSAPGADGLTSNQRFTIARAVIAAALADGVLSDQERGIIESHFDESEDLDESQRQRLRRDLVVPATIHELAQATATDPALRLPLFRATALVITADGVRDALENTWSSRLGEALAIDPATQTSTFDQIADTLTNSVEELPR